MRSGKTLLYALTDKKLAATFLYLYQLTGQSLFFFVKSREGALYSLLIRIKDGDTSIFCSHHLLCRSEYASDFVLTRLVV